jgi:hypothetical protein
MSEAEIAGLWCVAKAMVKHKSLYRIEGTEDLYQFATNAEELIGVVTGTIDTGCISSALLRESSESISDRERLTHAVSSLLAEIHRRDTEGGES